MADTHPVDSMTDDQVKAAYAQLHPVDKMSEDEVRAAYAQKMSQQGPTGDPHALTPTDPNQQPFPQRMAAHAPLALGVLGGFAGPEGAFGGAALGQGIKDMTDRHYGGGPKTLDEGVENALRSGAIFGAGDIAGGEVNAGLKWGANKALQVPAIKALADKGGSILNTIAQTLSGASKNDIATYAADPMAVKKLGAANNGSTFTAAQKMRQGAMDKIGKFKQTQNNAIDDAVENLPNEKTVEIAPIMQRLEAANAKINPITNPDASSQIAAHMDTLEKVIGEGETHASPAELKDITDYLQDQGASAYNKGGQVFIPAKQSAKAARDAAGPARAALRDVAPEMNDPNDALSALHKINNKLPPGLLDPEAQESTLLAGGSGGNQRSDIRMGRLDALTGTTLQPDARKLSAMRTFYRPSLLPMDTTGKAAARMWLARSALGGLGAAAGYEEGGGTGAGAGALMGLAASPFAVKSMIDAGYGLASQWASKLAGKVALSPWNKGDSQ